MSLTVVNTVPKSVRPAVAEDFSAVADRLDFNSGNRDPEIWNRHFPFTPQVAVDILSRDMPQSIKFKIGINGVRGNFSLAALEVKGQGTFDLAQKSVRIDLIRAEIRGDGLGRKSVRNQIEFFSAVGLNRFDVCAGEENGGHFWTFFGFVPKDEKTQKEVLGALLYRHEISKAFLEPELNAQLDDLLVASDDPSNLWAVADLEQDVGPHLESILSRVDDIYVDRDAVHGIDTFAEALRFKQCIQESITLAGQGHTVPYGRLLYGGQIWNAKMDTRNNQQVERAQARVQGWKTLGID